MAPGPARRSTQARAPTGCRRPSASSSGWGSTSSSWNRPATRPAGSSRSRRRAASTRSSWDPATALRSTAPSAAPSPGTSSPTRRRPWWWPTDDAVHRGAGRHADPATRRAASVQTALRGRPAPAYARRMTAPHTSLPAAPDPRRPLRITFRGRSLLGRALYNKDAAFTHEERDWFGLHGLLPSHVLTLDDQLQGELVIERENVRREHAV